MGTWLMGSLLMSLLLLKRNFSSVAGQACDGTESFERVNGLAPHAAHRFPLYSALGSPVTAECNNKCRTSQSCHAFLVHYDRSVCFRFSTRSDTGRSEDQLVPSPGRTSYYEKLCLRAPGCGRAWVFERVPGHELAGHDDLVVQSVTTRKRCQELCLMERNLPCRSAEYWAGGGICRMSKENKRTKPLAFRPAAPDVDYMENQCAPDDVPPTCEYEVVPDHEFAYVDLQLTARSQEECQKICEETPTFRCRSFVWVPAASQCQLSGADVSSIQGSALFRRSGSFFGQKDLCLDAQLRCNKDSMLLRLRTKEPFLGRIYSQNRPDCVTKGTGKSETEFRIPLLGACGGVEEEPNAVYSNQVVVQHHPIVQRKGDKAIRLVCRFDLSNRTLTSSLSFVVDAGRSEIPTSVVNSTAPAPNIRMRILDRTGIEIVGATLGQPLLLRIEIDDESIYGIFARNLVARSGANTESVTLIDEKGCPTDPSVFPGLTQLPTGKSLEGSFEAFRFSDDAVVRFQLDVQFCLQECRPARCELGDSFGRRRRELAKDSEESSFFTNGTSEGEVQPEVVYGETPLQKEIIVNDVVVLAELPHGSIGSDLPKVEDLEDLFCTTREVVVAAVVAAILFQVCVLAVCLLCIYLQKRKAGADKEEQLRREQALGLDNPLPVLMETHGDKPQVLLAAELRSQSFLRSLRTALRD